MIADVLILSLSGLLLSLCFYLMRKGGAKMEANIARLETAAASVDASAAKVALLVGDLNQVKTGLETLVEDLRRQLSEGGQIDTARLDAVSVQLERTDGVLKALTPAPEPQPQPQPSEGESVIDIARRASSGGQEPSGTVASERGT